MKKTIHSIILAFFTLLATSIHAIDNNTAHIVAGASFPIDIPDGDPNGILLPIDATGFFTGNIENLTLELGITHTWVGDLKATLYSPDNIAHLVVFSSTGYSVDNTIGDDSNLAGVYTFNDFAINDFWAEGTGVATIPTGIYRTSTAGNKYSYYGGCTTRLNGAFAGLTPDQANGIWHLQITDSINDDVGQVLSVALLADQLPPNYTIYKNSFEMATLSNMSYPPASDLQGSCKKAQYDFTGSGVSDYVTSWSSPFDGQVYFFLDGNNGPNLDKDSNVFFPIGFITNNTKITSGGDFDGDGITDVVTYEDSTVLQGYRKYTIRRSSRPLDEKMFYHSSVILLNTQIGDYNGDGLDELAWYYSSNESGLYTLLNGNLTFIWDHLAQANKRVAGGFDHNGDGIDDFTVFHEDNATNQIVTVFNGDGSGILYDSVTVQFNERPRQLPGNFNSGDLSKSGIGYYFKSGSSYTFAAVDDSNNFQLITNSTFGTSPTDIPLTGDYDGDGIDDFGVWRPNTDSNGYRFIIRPSSDPGNPFEFTSPESSSQDYPVANSRLQ